MEEVPRTRKKEVLSSHHVESSRPSLTTVSLEVPPGLKCTAGITETHKVTNTKYLVNIITLIIHICIYYACMMHICIII